MNPKKKAKQIIKVFKELERQKSKQSAEVLVDEVINQWEYVDTYLADLGGELNPNLRYWQEVKTELRKL